MVDGQPIQNQFHEFCALQSTTCEQEHCLAKTEHLCDLTKLVDNKRGLVEFVNQKCIVDKKDISTEIASSNQSYISSKDVFDGSDGSEKLLRAGQGSENSAELPEFSQGKNSEVQKHVTEAANNLEVRTSKIGKLALSRSRTKLKFAAKSANTGKRRVGPANSRAKLVKVLRKIASKDKLGNKLMVRVVKPKMPAASVRRRIFYCDVCCLQFLGYRQYWNHRVLAHTGQVFECLACAKKFKTTDGLFQHTKIVHKELPLQYITKKVIPNFYCEACGLGFRNILQMMAHTKRQHIASYGGCSLCPYESSHLYNLTQHMHSHNRISKTLFSCPVCKKKMYFLHVFINHLHSHSNVPPNIIHCCKCAFKTKNYFQYIKHMEIHQSRNLRYNCFVCSRIFTSIHKLSWHMRNIHKYYFNTHKNLIHTKVANGGETYRKCGWCGIMISSRSLKGHSEIHSKRISSLHYIACAICLKNIPKFCYKNHLRWHLSGQRTKHCPKLFKELYVKLVRFDHVTEKDDEKEDAKRKDDVIDLTSEPQPNLSLKQDKREVNTLKSFKIPKVSNPKSNEDSEISPKLVNHAEDSQQRTCNIEDKKKTVNTTAENQKSRRRGKTRFSSPVNKQKRDTQVRKTIGSPVRPFVFEPPEKVKKFATSLGGLEFIPPSTVINDDLPNIDILPKDPFMSTIVGSIRGPSVDLDVKGYAEQSFYGPQQHMYGCQLQYVPPQIQPHGFTNPNHFIYSNQGYQQLVPYTSQWSGNNTAQMAEPEVIFKDSTICSGCGKKFESLSKVEIHEYFCPKSLDRISSQHLHNCPICSQKFATVDTVKKHIFHSHPIVFKEFNSGTKIECRSCKKSFKNKGDLATHELSHQLGESVHPNSNEVKSNVNTDKPTSVASASESSAYFARKDMPVKQIQSPISSNKFGEPKVPKNISVTEETPIISESVHSTSRKSHSPYVKPNPLAVVPATKSRLSPTSRTSDDEMSMDESKTPLDSESKLKLEQRKKKLKINLLFFQKQKLEKERREKAMEMLKAEQELKRIQKELLSSQKTGQDIDIVDLTEDYAKRRSQVSDSNSQSRARVSSRERRDFRSRPSRSEELERLQSRDRRSHSRDRQSSSRLSYSHDERIGSRFSPTRNRSKSPTVNKFGPSAGRNRSKSPTINKFGPSPVIDRSKSPTVNKFGSYKCDKCASLFTNYRTYITHIETHDTDEVEENYLTGLLAEQSFNKRSEQDLYESKSYESSQLFSRARHPITESNLSLGVSSGKSSFGELQKSKFHEAQGPTIECSKSARAFLSTDQRPQFSEAQHVSSKSLGGPTELSRVQNLPTVSDKNTPLRHKIPPFSSSFVSNMAQRPAPFGGKNNESYSSTNRIFPFSESASHQISSPFQNINTDNSFLPRDPSFMRSSGFGSQQPFTSNSVGFDSDKVVSRGATGSQFITSYPSIPKKVEYKPSSVVRIKCQACKQEFPNQEYYDYHACAGTSQFRH